MADAAAAEMQQMKVEEEKKEVVTALAGAFGVAPPVDNGCVARDPTLFRDRARACLLAPTLRRSRSPAGAGTIDRPGSRRTARAWRARRALRASSFAPFDPPPERCLRGARGASPTLRHLARPTDPFFLFRTAG